VQSGLFGAYRTTAAALLSMPGFDRLSSGRFCAWFDGGIDIGEEAAPHIGEEMQPDDGRRKVRTKSRLKSSTTDFARFNDLLTT